MTNEVLVYLAVFVPLAGAVLLPLLGRISPMLRNLAALGLVATPFACSCLLLAGGQTTTVELTGMVKFQADHLAVFMAIVSSLISTVIVLYSISYISHYDHQNEYYLMVVLFLGAMMGLVYSANLLLLYVFWEITAIASWRLIGFFRSPNQVLRADKAFLVTVAGALAMLVGFVAIYTANGTMDLTQIKHGTLLPNFIGVLVLAGIFSKSATLPFHTWLPDAGVAPSPVTALLHAAVLVKIGVYVFARLFVVNFALTPELQTWVLIVAAASALVSAGAAMVETDIKRIIAYSTVSQIAFIFLGFAAVTAGQNQEAAIMGIGGALLYILMHGLAKGGLFLCAGIIEHGTHTKDITRMGGLIKTMPVTAIAFLFCALSVMGVPPFGGFFSKYMVISSAAANAAPWVALTFVAGAFMTIMYLFRLFNMVFLGQPRGELAREGSTLMVGCVALLALLSLAGGILISSPADIAHQTVQQMLGMIK